jgi:hypothetical protein
VRYHWIWEVASSKLVQLDNIHTDKNDLDMMTKILPQESWLYVARQRAWQL